MKNVTIQYFALLKEQRGLNEETIESSAATAAELYDELSQKHGFKLPVSALKVAVNDDFADWDTKLNPNDTIVFIPPVAGG